MWEFNVWKVSPSREEQGGPLWAFRSVEILEQWQSHEECLTTSGLIVISMRLEKVMVDAFFSWVTPILVNIL